MICEPRPLCRIIHEVCEEVAFYTTTKPVRGTPMMPDIVVLVDGTTPTFNDPVVCGSCGLPALSGDLVPEDGW